MPIIPRETCIFRYESNERGVGGSDQSFDSGKPQRLKLTVLRPGVLRKELGPSINAITNDELRSAIWQI